MHQSTDCRWLFTMATPSSRFPKAESPDAVVPTKFPLNRVLGRVLGDEHAVGTVARDQVTLGRSNNHACRRIVAASCLAADQIAQARL